MFKVLFAILSAELFKGILVKRFVYFNGFGLVTLLLAYKDFDGFGLVALLLTSFLERILKNTASASDLIQSFPQNFKILIELTCPGEEGIEAANVRKQARYLNLMELYQFLETNFVYNWRFYCHLKPKTKNYRTL